jgi:MerR family transcriptional regulator, copper efflux regulator
MESNPSNNTLLKSGQVALQSGVGVETLRYYEREGLLPQPCRSQAGYRQYPASAVIHVKFIKKAQQLGFTLKEVKTLLTLVLTPSHHAGPIKQLAEQKVAIIDEKIEALQEVKATLLSLLTGCKGKDVSIEDCPIINCLQHTQ